MEFQNSFEVPLPPAEAWKLLMDIERIAPCMPGAELTEVLGNNSYKGRINVRLGPVALSFAGIVKFEEIDEARHTARVSAQGTDAKGRGGANASSVFRLEPENGGSKVFVHSDLNLSGAVAQYGRGVGIIQTTAKQIINQFATCLKESLAHDARLTVSGSGQSKDGSSSTAVPSARPVAKPISGFKVLWGWLTGLLSR